MSNTTLRLRVKHLIETHGGLSKAADKLHIEPSYLYRLGTGERKNPGPSILRRLGLTKEVIYKLRD